MTKAHLAMLAAESKKLEQAGLFRKETIHPKHVVDFTSQDYLGFASDDRILAAARTALDKYGLGVSSSRVFTGTREIHRELEQALARFLQVPDALVLGSGYLANIGFYEALFDSRDCLFCDALVHPSTAEGMRLSSATAFPTTTSPPSPWPTSSQVPGAVEREPPTVSMSLPAYGGTWLPSAVTPSS